MSARRIPIQPNNPHIQFSFGFGSNAIPIISPFIRSNELNSHSNNNNSNGGSSNNSNNSNNKSDNSSKKLNREEYLVHKVQDRETLTGIALQYGVTVTQLKQLNGLWSNGEVLKKEIFIPIKINEMSEDQKQMIQRIQNRWNSNKSGSKDQSNNKNNDSKNTARESKFISPIKNGKEELKEPNLIQLEEEEPRYDEDNQSHTFIFDARESGGFQIPGISKVNNNVRQRFIKKEQEMFDL